MAQEGFKRKLAAILSADVEGYSRLMSEDEAHTIQTLKTYRNIMSEQIQNHSGRVIDSPGDNLLAEFSSAVDALQCAVEVQKKLKQGNDQFAEDKRLKFRIGVNIGDIVQDEDRIYGSGVNIAARIEGLADAGGICISRNTYDHVKDKLDLEYDYLGEHGVKNIEEPVRVYKVLIEWDPPKPSLKDQLELHEKPSIAVLPFDNMSGDPEQDYIGDGISESIISVLAISPGMLVIARNSTFVYKGKPVKVQQIAEDLSVRYVLEGSFLKAGDHIRITAQLVDAPSGHHIWTDQYDRNMEDFFNLLDDISKQIATELHTELIFGNTALTVSTTNNFKAWGCNVKGIRYFLRSTEEDFFKARECFENALKLDPDFPGAMVMLAFYYTLNVAYGWSKTLLEDMVRCEKLVQQVKELDDNLPLNYVVSSTISLLKMDHKKSFEEAKRAITLSPNDPSGYIALAYVEYFCGNFKEAVSLCEKAERLSPYRQNILLVTAGWSYRMIGKYEEAISMLKDLLDRAQKGEFSIWLAHNHLACTYAMQGDMPKARFHASEVLKINPTHSLEFNQRANWFKNPKHLEPILDALRKAGIPDSPPKKDSLL